MYIKCLTYKHLQHAAQIHWMCTLIQGWVSVFYSVVQLVTCIRPSPVLKQGSLTKSVSFSVNWCHNLLIKKHVSVTCSSVMCPVSKVACNKEGFQINTVDSVENRMTLLSTWSRNFVFVLTRQNEHKHVHRHSQEIKQALRADTGDYTD